MYIANGVRNLMKCYFTPSEAIKRSWEWNNIIDLLWNNARWDVQPTVAREKQYLLEIESVIDGPHLVISYADSERATWMSNYIHHDMSNEITLSDSKRALFTVSLVWRSYIYYLKMFYI